MNLAETMCLVHRYLYYVKLTPVISDAEYDELERMAVETTPQDSPVHKPGSSLPEDYPDYIRRLAGVLMTK